MGGHIIFCDFDIECIAAAATTTTRGTLIHSVLLRTLMSTLSYGKIQASWSTVEEVRPIHLELDGEYCFSKPISDLHMCISNRSYYGQKRAVKNEDFVDRTHHTTTTRVHFSDF